MSQKFDEFEHDIGVMYPGLAKPSWRRRHLVFEPSFGVIQKPGLVGMYRPHWRAPNVDGLYFASETFRSRGIGVDRASRAGLTVVEDILGKRLPGLRGDLALLMTATRPLEGRVALVTGAGRGIGKAIAARLADDGAAVVINDVDEDVAREASAEIPGSTIAVGSVADPAVTDEMVAVAEREFGTLDIVVNNAGLTKDSTLHRMTRRDVGPRRSTSR